MPQHIPGTWLRRWAGVLLVLAVFVGVGSWHWRQPDGEDLASSYVGARLLSLHQAAHLYRYDVHSFADIDDDTWSSVAHRGGFNGYLHPYVQTPLWAYGLQPLAARLSFPQFNTAYAVFNMLCFALTLLLVARFWAPLFMRPVPMALAVAGLAFSQPFRYAMYLNQTHICFVLLAVGALMLAERDRPWLAGLLLALAAAVKVTPIVLLLYWLVRRRFRAVGSTLLWSAALWFGTELAVGRALMQTYLADLHRISGVLLVAQNNQSLAAWWMAPHYPADAIFDIDILPLPSSVRLVSSALLVAFTLLGGWLDQRRHERPSLGETAAPLGAAMALVAATAFAPIAWTHYAVVLVIPAMLLADRAEAGRAAWLWVVIAVIVLLNFQPFATDVIHGDVGPLALVRGQFYACILALVALAVAGLRPRPALAAARA